MNPRGGKEIVRGREGGEKKNEFGQISTRPNNRIKTSAADHKDPAVPVVKNVPFRLVISFPCGWAD